MLSSRQCQNKQAASKGKVLVTAIAVRPQAANLNARLIWALRDNSACESYQSTGGQLVGDRLIHIGGRQLVEVAYGWLDLSVFFASAQPV